ncbi:Dehydrogenase/reductase SDR family member 11 17-beta-hydroxysteroid dehydrogenase [Channa argus]|uniref:Dehydrogenase/reductase SDR family member 11 n=1 Tax=Channa argus TaxID=215402 RepID=A0A6G1PQR0_CHAAH|nr:Dehydrogenase/reductase SDR family member 11 17-beta-hydroxysteroid dehydrogenase [Channa argus]
MDRWRGRVALVTGASVGIGAAIVKELVRFGMRVVGCARDIEKLQILAAECQTAGYSGVFMPFKCDLNNEEEILSMFSAIKEQHKGVDVCINNAGLALPEPLLSGKTSGWKNLLNRHRFKESFCTALGSAVPPNFYLPLDVLQVNVLALSICTREAYQSMKERNVDDGHIVNINSVCGHQVLHLTDMHFYTATKFAVTALTESLRQELRDANTNIRATSISPGMVETEFAWRLHRDNPAKAVAKYSQFKPLEAVDVANAVIYVLSAPPNVQIEDIQVQAVGQVSLPLAV